jgi:tetratricopeptide (TPR) repeat protein
MIKRNDRSVLPAIFLLSYQRYEDDEILHCRTEEEAKVVSLVIERIEVMNMSNTTEKDVFPLEKECSTLADSSDADNNFVEIGDDFRERMISRAKTSLSKKDHDDALEACQLIIEKDPDYSEAYVGQGYTYLDMGLWKSGIRSLKRAACLGNKNAMEFLKQNIFEISTKNSQVEISVDKHTDGRLRRVSLAQSKHIHRMPRISASSTHI